MRIAWTRVLLVLASLLLALGTVSGVLNRQVFDGARFASHADAIREDAAVSQLVGEAISNRVIGLDPDLVALQPAIQSVMVQLVRSPTFTPVVEFTVRQVHEAFTRPHSGQIVVRLADLTAVVVGTVRALAPDIAESLPANLDVQLANIGGQSFAAGVIQLSRWSDFMGWLLPLLALLCLILAMWASRVRQRTLAFCGLSIAGSGALVAIAWGAVSIALSRADVSTLRGALESAAWRQFGPPFLTAAAVLAVAGLVLFAAAGAYLPQWSVASIEARLVQRVRQPGPEPRWQWFAAGVLVVAGGAAVYRPWTTVRVVVVLMGLAALVAGVSRISRLAAAGRGLSPETGELELSRVRGGGRFVLAVVALLGLAAFLVVSGVPSTRQVPAAASAQVKTSPPDGCNGFVQLCSRRYDKVAYVTTHNSMSAADQPGWFIPEQPTGLVGQLNAGVRTLLVDTWYGQATQTPGVIVNAPASKGQALADANAEFGADVVQSALRLRSALNLTPLGPVEAVLLPCPVPPRLDPHAQ